MNCDSCGAPLTLLNERDYFYCDYCATFRYPPAADASDDGVTPLGDRTEMRCPLCRANLSAGKLEGRRVAFCETCRGVFVSNDDFSDIARTQRSRYAGPPDKPVPVNPGELKRRIDCPACGNAMDTHPYYGPGSVVIDSCCRCRTVWLDRGEIGAIERAPGQR